MFHASLLQEHIPNDDRLFPGRMDTQIGNNPETEGEWAVDRILSHAGSRMDSVFEINGNQAILHGYLTIRSPIFKL